MHWDEQDTDRMCLSEPFLTSTFNSRFERWRLVCKESVNSELEGVGQKSLVSNFMAEVIGGLLFSDLELQHESQENLLCLERRSKVEGEKSAGKRCRQSSSQVASALEEAVDINLIPSQLLSSVPLTPYTFINFQNEVPIFQRCTRSFPFFGSHLSIGSGCRL